MISLYYLHFLKSWIFSAAIRVCCSFLESQLHPSNALGILNFAEIHSCGELKLAALKFVDAHFMDVVDSEEFPLLPPNQVVPLTSYHKYPTK